VEERTELFLRETFTPMEIKTTRMYEENVLFQTPLPHLINDCGMLKDCRSPHIQAFFLDAVGPIMSLLGSINKEDEIFVENMEATVRAALSFCEM